MTISHELRGAAAALFQCSDPEILVEGRAGTGKTTAILRKLIYTAERYPGARILVCRNTRESLTESVLDTFDEMVLPGMAGYSNQKAENRTQNIWPNGSIIVWAGLDKPGKLFSTKWDRIYVAEALDVSFEKWDYFARSLRNFKTPYHQRIADVNPGPPGHWLNKRATPAGNDLRDSFRSREAYNRLQHFNHNQKVDKMRRLISVHPDNPGYWDMNAWAWTAMGQEYVAKTLASMSGHVKLRMFDGRWVAAEGVVFPEFDENRHVVKDEFDIPADWPIYWGWDPGVDHPTAILWFAVAPNGNVYIVEEIHESGRAIIDDPETKKMGLATQVRELEKARGWRIRRRYADPQEAFSRQKATALPLASQWSKLGMTLSPWPRTGNNYQEMVEAVRKLLILGKLKIFARCTNTIGEFQSWRYKRNAAGEIPGGSDAYENIGDDAMDVVKGMVATGLAGMGEQVKVLDNIAEREERRRDRDGEAAAEREAIPTHLRKKTARGRVRILEPQ